MFTIQLVVHICWKKYLLELQEAISREACVSMQSWGKLWVSQNHSSLFDVSRKTQNGLMCRANCKMAWCGAQIISGHYSAHTRGTLYSPYARTSILLARDLCKVMRSNLCGISHIFAAQVLGTCAHMLVSHNAQWPLAFVLDDNRVRIHKHLDDHLQDNWSITNNHLFYWRSYNVEVLWLYKVGIATSRSPGNRKWGYCKTWIW